MENKRILIVEDDLFILNMYVTKLKSDGFIVESAEDGMSAIQMAKKNIPDVILLDVIMPVMDGFETLAQIKKEERLKDVPIILLTNLSQKPNIEKGLKMGAVDYIIKAHFTPSEVVDKIRKVLSDGK
ncbi:response regulator [bacterium]|nr:MAG: response regulator [bacterium]